MCPISGVRSIGKSGISPLISCATRLHRAKYAGICVFPFEHILIFGVKKRVETINSAEVWRLKGLVREGGGVALPWYRIRGNVSDSTIFRKLSEECDHEK